MINLTHNNMSASINPEGAWVEELSDDGQPILFPKTDLTSDSGGRKNRGGMHVCLPNFGPGGVSGLAQHGFGRDSLWRIVHEEGSFVELELTNQVPQYAGLVTTLHYELHEKSFTASLTTRNNGATSLRIAPGFHPYFYLDESETAVAINDTVYELGALSGTEFLQGDTVLLRMANRTIEVSQQALPAWAVWTDSLANYVCVEPTYGGYRFLESSTPDEHLTPGAEKTFVCSISW